MTWQLIVADNLTHKHYLCWLLWPNIKNFTQKCKDFQLHILPGSRIEQIFIIHALTPCHVTSKWLVWKLPKVQKDRRRKPIFLNVDLKTFLPELLLVLISQKNNSNWCFKTACYAGAQAFNLAISSLITQFKHLLRCQTVCKHSPF